MECPIGSDEIHCQNCYSWRHGKCVYDEIMKERKHRDEMTQPADPPEPNSAAFYILLTNF